MESAQKKIVTRLAPSPTGFMHVGTLRTGLYAYLLAKQHGGTFILRIEDTDRERFVQGAVENLLEAMYWAGVIPDEGVTLEGGVVKQQGPHGPYIQSEKLPVYKKYAEQLVAQGNAYYCFCTPERLEEVRSHRQANKLPPGYDGHCKTLTSADVEIKLAANARHVIRLAMPDAGETVFTDLVRGEVSFQNADVDDQVLLKSDGFPTYHLAVVVDDHDMEVTHIVRGEEWISSTPKHIALYTYLGWTIPEFAHLSLLLNTDKSKLSKRQGDVAVLDYRDKGYLPEALVNFVAFLGWNPGTEQELFTLEELIQAFSLPKVGKAGAVFNLEKLDWYNREYLKKMNPVALATYLDAYMPAEIKTNPKYSHAYLAKLAPILVERISKGADLAEMHQAGELAYFFSPAEYDTESLFWKTMKESPDRYTKLQEQYQKVMELLSGLSEQDFTEANIKNALWSYAEAVGKGEVLWPIRYALSGRDKSPDPFILGAILGKEEALARIKLAEQKLG